MRSVDNGVDTWGGPCDANEVRITGEGQVQYVKGEKNSA